MKKSLQKIRALPEFKELSKRIQAFVNISPLGLGRSVRLPVLAALHQALNRPILLIAKRTNEALTILDELSMWIPDSHPILLPEPTSLFYEDISWGGNNRRERISAFMVLLKNEFTYPPANGISPIVIAPARAVMTRTMSKHEFLRATFLLRTGHKIDPINLASKLVENAYDSVATVTAPGQFARRGGIMDIWPPSNEFPTRLDFFDDQIDTMRNFDPANQLSSNRQEQLLVSPAREYLLSKEIRAEEEGEEFNELNIPIRHPEPASLIDYLPNNTLVATEDWQAIHDTITEIDEQAIGFREDSLAAGIITNNFPIPYLTYGEILDSLDNLQTIELGPVADLQASQLSSKFSNGQRFGGQLKPVMEHLQQLHARGDEFTIISRQAARLQELWLESSIYQEDDVTQHFIEGSLAEGWILTPSEGVQLHILTDGEIFGWRRPQLRQRPRIIPDSPESNFSDLKLNTLVVHVDHGIGRFKGLVDRSVEDIEHEYLCVEYAEGDQLYVPVHQADRITQYVGSKGAQPLISRLGGIEWRRVKSRVNAAVQEIAEDLLELYAKRKTAEGYAFSADTDWQAELEASFPYIETDDQLRVIDEVKRDMESPRPMDRLVCGDVGFGKTEVALRAAFKAVMDGKQVAILVPTTILAQQHFRTFQQRLAAFPVEVEMLSRFRTRSQQQIILSRMQDGTLDIVIGTHRLVQSDVKFNELGLVIIDEEQRFGVAHKEHLKQLRSQVDVLTMTATPIPRTMYMALTGVRDISTINTPPEERLPIVTHVGSYSPRLVRQAILRELERGGQVFFVHNRVQTILAMRNLLSRMVPEARIEIVHGQMAEKILAIRMQKFNHGEIDVLLTTSIIESGLDIPNANTLIVDRADTFGLAQLYQLRGRVGRGAQRAYAYFFTHQNKLPTEEGKFRLDTIAENSRLGSGYSIAMRDLEIRGTGDILGTRQHGHISAVGFHLYTRLLNQAVDHIRKTGKLSTESTFASASIYHPLINIDLPFIVNIPQQYVPDKSMRLGLYRRLAEMNTLKEIKALTNEFTDRFGTPPESVENLFYQLRIKLLAEKAGLESITGDINQLSLRFPSLPKNASPRQYPNLGKNARTSKNTIWLSIKANSTWQDRLVELLIVLGEKMTTDELQVT